MIDFDSFWNALAARGIRRAFGIPGTQSLELLDALRRSDVSFTLAAHELGAAFMANGYYRASGEPAVLVTIGGPGFTNALTGIAEARLDSVPLVHVASAPATGPGERFQLQAIDQASIAGPLVKRRLRLTEDTDPVVVVEHALGWALDGEPGPVLIEYGSTAAPLAASSPDEARARDIATDPALLDELASKWGRAARPVLLVGQGAASESARLRAVVERARAPVITTPSARGILPEDHPLALGFDVLRGGVEVVNELFDRADLILALGCKLGHNGSAGFGFRLPPDRLVRVDTSDEVLEANYPAVLKIRCDAATALASLDALPAGPEAERQPWAEEEIADYRRRIRQPDGRFPDLSVQGSSITRTSEFLTTLRTLLPRQAMLVTDSGLHQILARRWFDVLAPRGLCLPSDFQSMGFGIPAAIGARIGAPDRPVAALVGDGGFLMSGLEIATAVRERLPLLVIVFNDGRLNQIRQQQVDDSGRPFGVELPGFDFESFAAAVGARFHRFDRVSDPRDLVTTFELDGPTILEVRLADSPAMRARAAGARLKSVARTVRDATMGRRDRAP